MGTLDSLMVLSDDLVKTNTLVEAVVNKLRRQLFDLQTSGARAACARSRWGRRPAPAALHGCRPWQRATGLERVCTAGVPGGGMRQR